MSSELVPGLTAFLQADEDLRKATEGLISPDFLPDGRSMGLAFYRSDEARRRTFSGAGPERMTIEFECNAPTKSGAEAMVKALQRLLDRYRGQLPGGVYLTSAFFVKAFDGRSSATLQHQILAQFVLNFNLT